MAEAVLGQRRNHAPALIAAVEALDEHVPDLSGPVLRLVEEGIDIGQTWLELYTNLHIRLIKLAADQRAKTGEGSPVFSEPDAAERYLRGVLSE